MKKERYCEKECALQEGLELVKRQPLFSCGYIETNILGRKQMGRDTAISVCINNERIYLNKDFVFTAKEWMFVIAVGALFIYLGCMDAELFVGENRPLDVLEIEKFKLKKWLLACSIYNIRFVESLKMGENPFGRLSFLSDAETVRDIYDVLINRNADIDELQRVLDEISTIIAVVYDGSLVAYKAGEFNRTKRGFEENVIRRAQLALKQEQQVSQYMVHDRALRRQTWKAIEWFTSSFPLLGGVASSFQIIEDVTLCQKLDIQIAAVDAEEQIIYLNPTYLLDEMEMRFVLAHELLHASLQHHKRNGGRDPYLFNVAADYVINGWLNEMQVGSMPKGCLYDPKLKDKSAEEVYDMLIENIRLSKKQMTFRGYGQGEFLEKHHGIGVTPIDALDLDEYYRQALQQGLEAHRVSGRGFIPAGLIENIKALSVPPISWDVELGHWFAEQFPDEEISRSYVCASRRQSATPNIPRPGKLQANHDDLRRTFGVVLDTSGSMSARMLGIGLGAIASYSVARNVSHARIIFCDAMAYDAGYMPIDEVAGQVQIKGRGGTVLQKGIDTLLNADDFPKDAPILIITDGQIEKNLQLKGTTHAYILPKGRALPFKTKGHVFYMA